MFDNPKKELRRLEDALRAVDEQESEWIPDEEEPEEEEEDFGPGKNEAVDFARTVYADEDEDIFAVRPLTKKERKKRKKQQNRQAKKDKKQRKKKKGQHLRLILLAALEIAAIIAIVRWWLPWLT